MRGHRDWHWWYGYSRCSSCSSLLAGLFRPLLRRHRGRHLLLGCSQRLGVHQQGAIQRLAAVVLLQREG